MKYVSVMLLVVTAVLLLQTACGRSYKESDYEREWMRPGQAAASQSEEYAENRMTAEALGNAEEGQKEETEMYLYIGENRLAVSLDDNSSAEELLEILKSEDIVYTAEDYGGFEKVGEIDRIITSNNKQITTSPGDVILYQGNHICLYYGQNSWSFTRIGKIKGYSTDELKKILKAGKGEIEVRISGK